MRVRWGAHTDVGRRRETNQDNFGVAEPAPGDHTALLLVVCDGMGGHLAGEVASKIGVETVLEHYRAAANDDPEALLAAAFTHANQRIYAEGRGSMGTTGVAALLTAAAIYIANVGDSRAYLIRGGTIRQLSRDHSLVSDQVSAGILTPEQARASSIRNIITRALGHQSEVEVDLFAEPIYAGDLVLLSSDGMHGLVEDHEIVALIGSAPPEEAATRLVETANERGGPDNITVVLAHVEALDDEDEDEPAAAQAGPSAPAEPPLTALGAALATLVLLCLLALGACALLGPTAAAPPPLMVTAAPAPYSSEQ